MDIILEKSLLVEELIELNTYIFMIKFNSNSNDLEYMLNDKLEETDFNFYNIYKKIEELIEDIKIEMRQLNESQYNKWNLLDLILLNLEKSLQLINKSLFNPKLERMFEELFINY